MKDFFQIDTDEHRMSLFARARKVALFALQQYDLAWERIQFIQLSDTITYKIETSAAEKYLLRIHSDRWSKDEIRSELMLLQALRQGAGLTVPEGLASRDGSCVLEVDTEEGYRRPYVTIMRWVEGDSMQGEMTDSDAYSMGVMAGKLHDAAAQFAPPSHFVRPSWGAESFREELGRLEKYYARFLSEAAWGAYQAAANQILASLVRMPKNRDNYGLIHADLHTGNIVFHEGKPYPIDFGRCGYGYYLYDIASTILGLYPQHREVFLQGYEQVRRLTEEDLELLECFFVMVMIGNYSHHAANPTEISGLIAEQPYAQAIIRDFLKVDPFLFQVIKPVEIERVPTNMS
ncbi:aminoglycoside phosphotransferase [Paenibacillus selenitireducens]|uniref:Aminoglycoside phosphotransferase n=1 Tax=Paenibacillus selenitireducens TaxID=1324314 RepID=A0A1T2XCS4_9BACL|nr:phosphotransferase [Paenibacillus selenitireducens]OPA77413.1 aminoglycoside phosphotransferase [Paenibacillus selenitireducens]